MVWVRSGWMRPSALRAPTTLTQAHARHVAGDPDVARLASSLVPTVRRAEFGKDRPNCRVLVWGLLRLSFL